MGLFQQPVKYLLLVVLLFSLFLTAKAEARGSCCPGNGGLQCYCCPGGPAPQPDQSHSWRPCSCCASDPASPDHPDLILVSWADSYYYLVGRFPEFPCRVHPALVMDPPLKPPRPVC